MIAVIVWPAMASGAELTNAPICGAPENSNFRSLPDTVIVSLMLSSWSGPSCPSNSFQSSAL